MGCSKCRGWEDEDYCCLYDTEPCSCPCHDNCDCFFCNTVKLLARANAADGAEINGSGTSPSLKNDGHHSSTAMSLLQHHQLPRMFSKVRSSSTNNPVTSPGSPASPIKNYNSIKLGRRPGSSHGSGKHTRNHSSSSNRAYSFVTAKISHRGSLSNTTSPRSSRLSFTMPLVNQAAFACGSASNNYPNYDVLSNILDSPLSTPTVGSASRRVSSTYSGSSSKKSFTRTTTDSRSPSISSISTDDISTISNSATPTLPPTTTTTTTTTNNILRNSIDVESSPNISKTFNIAPAQDRPKTSHKEHTKLSSAIKAGFLKSRIPKPSSFTSSFRSSIRLNGNNSTGSSRNHSRSNSKESNIVLKSSTISNGSSIPSPALKSHLLHNIRRFNTSTSSHDSQDSVSRVNAGNRSSLSLASSKPQKLYA